MSAISTPIPTIMCQACHAARKGPRPPWRGMPRHGA
jgi:hypothetical protein